MNRAEELVELMDNPACNQQRLFATYRHFRWMNPLLGNWKWLVHEHIIPYFRQHPPEGYRIRLLDIGCGGGDVITYLSTELQKAGFLVSALGIDPDPNAQRFRNQYAVKIPNLQFQLKKTGELHGKFDLIVSNHLLHHLTLEELDVLCSDCKRLSAGLVLHNDLYRSAWSYALYTLFFWPLHFNSFAWVDGRRSIRRAWRKHEIINDPKSSWRFQRHGLFRFLLRYEQQP
jgi:2-polyprenyl-3-methyl-5-hydroxy-6-metoxy-1,4-benzoquinol methylase